MANITKFSETTKFLQVLNTIYARTAILFGLLHLITRALAFFIFAPTEILGLLINIIPVIIAAFIFPLYIKTVLPEAPEFKLFSLLGLSGIAGIIIGNVLLYVIWFMITSMGNLTSEFWMQSLFLGMAGDIYLTLIYLILPFIVVFVIGIFVFRNRALVKKEKSTPTKTGLQQKPIEDAEIIDQNESEEEENGKNKE